MTDRITTTTYGTGQLPCRVRADARPGSFLRQAVGSHAADQLGLFGPVCPSTGINHVWTMADKRPARHLEKVLT